MDGKQKEKRTENKEIIIEYDNSVEGKKKTKLKEVIMEKP